VSHGLCGRNSPSLPPLPCHDRGKIRSAGDLADAQKLPGRKIARGRAGMYMFHHLGETTSAVKDDGEVPVTIIRRPQIVRRPVRGLEYGGAIASSRRRQSLVKNDFVVTSVFLGGWPRVNITTRSPRDKKRRAIEKGHGMREVLALCHLRLRRDMQPHLTRRWQRVANAFTRIGHERDRQCPE
jgi:hypothetical protein